MKKLFISQPMNGKTDEKILREREEAILIAQDIVGEEVEVLETFFDDFGTELRDFTEEEKEAYEKSLNKIYKPIGVNVLDL